MVVLGIITCAPGSVSREIFSRIKPRTATRRPDCARSAPGCNKKNALSITNSVLLSAIDCREEIDLLSRLFLVLNPLISPHLMCLTYEKRAS